MDTVLIILLVILGWTLISFPLGILLGAFIHAGQGDDSPEDETA